MKIDTLFGGNKQTARKTKFPLPYYAATKAKICIFAEKFKKLKQQMSKKAIIVSICLMASMISCAQSQQSRFGGSPLLVEYLDFSMNVREFYPFFRRGQYIAEVPLTQSVLLADIADIPRWLSTNISLGKNIFQDEVRGRLLTPHIYFYHSCSSNIFQLATFDDFVFSKLHMITTLDYEIMSVAVTNAHGTEEVADNLLHFLNKKYGNGSKRVVESFGREGYILYWELSDRIKKFRSALRFGNIHIRLDIVNKEFAHKFEDRYFVWRQ